MQCPKCQIENPSNRKFCRECGAKLVLACPKCQFENLPSDNFCGDCGHDLTKPSEVLRKELSFDEKLDKIQRYLPKDLTQKILAQRDKIEGERKQVTVMFCDIEGFTVLTEKLGAETMYSIMDEVYGILIHKVCNYEGTVNELTGDGIMALFGAPIALEDAPQRAIRSALAIHREINKFSDRIKQEKGIPTFKMRIGIHTGPVVVGTLGNDLRVDFKAVGDTVNLASRMEGLAEPGTTYVTKDTYRFVREYFKFRALGEIQVKGKEKPVEAYQVLGLGLAKSRLEAAKAGGLTEFIGRRKELENLIECFGKVKAGHGQVVGIVGDAGIGKSRIVLEFRKSVEKEDLTFLEGQCLTSEQSTPYRSFINIIKEYFEVEEGDLPFVVRKKISSKVAALDKALMEITPFLCDILSVPPDDFPPRSLGPEEKRKLTFEAIKALFLRESQVKTLIIILDNLQWMDKESQKLLSYLVESMANARVLILGIYRPGHLHPWSDKSYYTHMGSLTPSIIKYFQSWLMRAKVLKYNRDIELSELFACHQNLKLTWCEGRTAGNIGDVLLHVDNDHLSDAGAWFQKAIDADTRNGFRWQLATDHACYADWFKKKRDIPGAKEQLTKAINLFRECGADGWVTRTEQKLASFA